MSGDSECDTHINDPSANPSTMVFVKDGKTVTVKRTVTNVGAAGCTYTAEVIAPVGAKVVINPPTLSFSEVGEKAEFSVSLTGVGSGGSAAYSEGYLTWVSSEHKVKSRRKPTAAPSPCKETMNRQSRVVCF